MKKLDLLLNYIITRRGKAGNEFLRYVVKNFGELAAKDFVVLSRTSKEDSERSFPVVVYEKGKIKHDINYSLDSIYHETISSGNNACHGTNAGISYNTDFDGPKIIESYISLPLWASNGEIIGMITVLDELPIEDSEREEISVMLKVISASLAPEIETDSNNDFADLILNIFPGLFFIYDISEGIQNAKILRYNKKWYTKKLGYGSDELPGSYPDFFFSPMEMVKVQEIFKELNAFKYADFELNTRHKEGYDIPYLYVANIYSAENSTYLIGFGIDISERKYAESALKQSEQYFKTIFNTSTDGIIVMDLDYKLLNANKVIFKMFDYKFEDIAFQNILDLLPPASRSVLKKRSLQLLNNEMLPPIELDVTKRTGEIVPIEINSIIIHYGDRKGILTTVRDLTERKMFEKKIFNSEIVSEEKERERFAKELHDGLGPILSTCKIYLHSLNEMVEKRKDLLQVSDRALALLDDALGSIKEISNNLSPHVLRNFGLVHAVISFTHNIESLSKMNFEVHYNYDKRLNEIIEFTSYRILTELINNTLKHAEASLVKIEIYFDDPILKVSYSDNGKGFDLEGIKKQNKGFGLINIENRVTKFNGEFSYSTSPGKGVNVEFTLGCNQNHG